MVGNRFTRRQTANPAIQRQNLGYVPPRGAVGKSGGGVTVTDGPSPEISLEPTAVTPGTYGDATNVPQVTVDQAGRITAAVDVPIALPTATTFGTGAPAGTPADGDLYFDTTLAVYVGYVGRTGAWHQF